MAPSTPDIYTLSLHDALPISSWRTISRLGWVRPVSMKLKTARDPRFAGEIELAQLPSRPPVADQRANVVFRDRKSTRLNSSHITISYAVFCLKKKKSTQTTRP